MTPFRDNAGAACAVLESMAAGIIVWTREARVADCNAAAERIFARTRDSLLGCAPAEVNPGLVDSDRRSFGASASLVEATLATGEPRDVETTLSRGDGVQQWLRESCRALRDRAGLLIGCVTTFVDITETKATSKRLGEILDGANVGTWELDIGTGHLSRGPKWFLILGLAPDSVPPTFEGLRALTHEDDFGLLASITQLWLSAMPFRVELRLRTGSGEWKWVQIRGRAQLDATGVPITVAGVLVDVDARKRVEAALAESLAAKVQLVAELQDAFKRIQHLEGLLPICMFCKSIRERANWVNLEQYITQHSNAQFSHGICPLCLEKNYPAGA
jgi:PAS domain S-box-containing protein